MHGVGKEKVSHAAEMADAFATACIRRVLHAQSTLISLSPSEASHLHHEVVDVFAQRSGLALEQRAYRVEGHLAVIAMMLDTHDERTAQKVMHKIE